MMISNYELIILVYILFSIIYLLCTNFKIYNAYNDGVFYSLYAFMILIQNIR